MLTVCSSDHMQPWVCLRPMLDKFDQSFPSGSSSVTVGPLVATLLLLPSFLWFLIWTGGSRRRSVSFFWKDPTHPNRCPFLLTRLQRLVLCLFSCWNNCGEVCGQARQGLRFFRHVSTDHWLNCQGYLRLCSPQTLDVFSQLQATIAKQLSSPSKKRFVEFHCRVRLRSVVQLRSIHSCL